MVYIYANIGGILMVNVTIYSIHGSYGTLNELILMLSILSFFGQSHDPV